MFRRRWINLLDTFTSSAKYNWWGKQSLVPGRDNTRSKLFFDEQQSVNQDKNITTDEDEPMDVDTISQRLQASNIFDNFYTTN